eukprot:SAG22_NODE_6326_length_870_cov_1.203632_1_plen_128_part_10
MPGWANLATAAQYELEYLLPLVGRIRDVLDECAAANRHAPGRVSAGILAELRAMVELGSERIEGQMDRARIASGHGSRGHSGKRQCCTLASRPSQSRRDIASGSHLRAGDPCTPRPYHDRFLILQCIL